MTLKYTLLLWNLFQAEERFLPPVKHRKTFQQDGSEVTLVTAYISIGFFKKYKQKHQISPDLYHKWIQAFQRITNPVVAYFNRDEDIKIFKANRHRFPVNRTKIVKISLNKTWAFSLLPTIKKIFSNPTYPNISPDTYVPEYSCVMHLKYEIMSNVVYENPFNTKYFAWTDIGLFRDRIKKHRYLFSIQLPPRFQENLIAYTALTYFRNSSFTSKQIVKSLSTWICGGFFIGERELMKRWTRQYMKYTEKMLGTGWMGSDQQVLYYMFQPQYNRSSQFVNVQPYKSDGTYHKWFYLGYLCSKPAQSNV